MSSTPNKGSSPSPQNKNTPAEVVGHKYPYAILGALVIAGLIAVVSLLMLGVTGPGVFSFTLNAAFLGIGTAMLILTVSTLYLFFTLRSASKKLAQQQQELQNIRDLAQDGRLSSLETTRTGSKVSSTVRDERLSSLEDSQSGSKSGAASMMVEITRLESRIASLEKPRLATAPVVQLILAKPANLPATRPSPFGDVHAVVDVEGIGPDYADRLNAAGIFNTRQLWEADAQLVAAAIETPLANVEKWQQMSELIAVKGIGPQYAELLVRSGMKTIVQLRDANETELVAAVTKMQASVGPRVQGNTIGHANVGNWIRAARDHKAVPTGQTFSGMAK